MAIGIDAVQQMKAYSTGQAGLQSGARFLFCSQDGEVAAQLAQALKDVGMVAHEASSAEQIGRRIADLDPRIIFLDFTLSPNAPGKLSQAVDLAHTMARVAPDLPRVAVGRLAQPEGAIAALRAGVTDFVDPVAAPQDVRDAVERLLKMVTFNGAHRGTECRDVLLIGTRAGVGTSTLAAHLAALTQGRYTQEARVDKSGASTGNGTDDASPLSSRAALLDLGLPIGDAQLYGNVTGGFDFAEAVRNLQRLDATLLGSAMAHTDDGLSVMALPRDPVQMNQMSLADSLSVFDRLRQHFGAIITDTGGLTNVDFVAGLARSSYCTWIVTDQSVSSLVCLASLLQELDQQQVARDSLKLIVNRYDERYGMTAKQIAERFGIELITSLPDRTLALMTSLNQGRLLHRDAERDPYVRGVQALVNKVYGSSSQSSARSSGWLAQILPRLHRRRQAMG